MPASPPSSPPPRTPGRRSPTIRSPPWCPTSAWSASTARNSSSPTFPGLIEGASRGPGPGRSSSSAMSSAARCCCIWSTAPRRRSPRTTAPSSARLAEYGAGLDGKPVVLALNKVDALDDKTRKANLKKLEKASGGPVMALSGGHRRRRDRGAARAARRRSAPTGCGASPRWSRSRRDGIPERGAPAGGQDRLGAAGRPATAG